MQRSKREIVFVSAAALAAAYAVYAFAFAPKRWVAVKATSPAVPADTTSASGAPTLAGATARAIAQIQQEIGRTTISPLVRLAAGRAGEEWRPAFFLGAPLPDELKQRDADRQQQQLAAQTAQQQAEAKRKAEAEKESHRLAAWRKRFDYTGYVCVADRLYAVINGAVYEAGDRLDNLPECSVKSVSPEGVVIEDSDRAVTVQVPLRPEWTQEHPQPVGNGGP